MKNACTRPGIGCSKLQRSANDARTSQSQIMKHRAPSGLNGSNKTHSVAARSSPEDGKFSTSTATLRVWEQSELAVSVYPRFQYNAVGAGGPGLVVATEGTKKTVRFDIDQLQIPDLDYKSTRVLGIPIPPPLCIKINTKLLKGTVDTSTGETQLMFVAEFLFSIGALYKAPPLSIDTVLTTGYSTGVILSADGSPLVNGRGKLVGAARVPRTGDWFLDSFLMLPTDALAQLAVEIIFS
eukprot:g3591.t1